MPKFQRCPADVDKLAMELLLAYESHGPTLSAKITFDFVFAYADTDDDGKPLGDTLTKNGVKALGLARKIPLMSSAGFAPLQIGTASPARNSFRPNECWQWTVNSSGRTFASRSWIKEAA